METIFYYVLVPLFILGIAINIHEFGHFIVGKIFGMRIEAYSFFGLGPRLFGFKRGHTDYRISAIPLGAYVKFYGDEATAPLEGGSSETEPIPDSELFELRPRWQKFLVMIGGPFMNIMLALAIPFVSALINGVPAMPTPTVAHLKADGAAAKAGVQIGDKIVSFNGVENPTWRNIELDTALLPEKNIPLVVERSGERVNLTVMPTKESAFGQSIGSLDLQPDFGIVPVFVGTVGANTPAAEAGIVTGDRIISINGATARNSGQVSGLIQRDKDAPLKIVLERDGKTREITTQVRKLDDGTERLGIGFSSASRNLEPANAASALSYAWQTNLSILEGTGKALMQVLTGNRSARDAGVSGPIGIFQQSANVAQSLGWEGVIMMLMAISLSLGVFNLLPIPMLDGGQIMVLFIDKVFSLFGKPLSMAVREKIQIVGFGLIMLLMISVIYLDVSRIIGF